MEENHNSVVTANSPVTPVEKDSMPPIPQKKSKKILIFAGLGVTLLFILILLSYYLFLPGNKNVSYAYNAYNRYKEGNYEKSYSLAKEGLAKYPDDPTLLRIALDSSSSLANSNGTEKQTFEQNKALIEKALKVGSNNPDVLLAVGYAHETAGEYEKALSYYGKALAIKPTAEAYFHKGHTLAFLDKKAESKEAYDKSYALDPESPIILMIRGAQFEEEGKPALAIENYVLAAKSKRTTIKLRSQALTAAAMAEIGQGHKQQALEYSQAAVKLDPTYSHALGIYGFMLTYSNDTYKKGIENLTKAIKQNPRISLNYMLLGVSMRARQQYTTAISLQKEAIIRADTDNTIVGVSQKNSRKSKMYYELAQDYSLTKDVPNTIISLREAIALNSAYKTLLRTDIKLGYFKFVATDPKFVGFINS